MAAEAATGHEGESLPALVEQARWSRHSVAEGCTDQGYASDAVYRALAAKRVTAFVPHQRQMLSREPARTARERCKSPPGVGAAVDRMTHGEGAISELKLCHRLDRARCRGTPKLQVQLLPAATAINLKRLLGRPSAGENARAGDRDAAVRRHLQLIGACLHWLSDRGASGSLTGS